MIFASVTVTMKINLFVVFFLAITPETLGQTTPASIMPIVTTNCGRRAVQCWNNQQAAIRRADDNGDIATGCKQYKLFLDCFNKVNATCWQITEVKEVSEHAEADRAGMCLYDGTLTTCGQEMQTCMSELMAILNDYRHKNTTAACPLINKFDDCSDNTRLACGDDAKTQLSEFETKLQTDRLLIGCDGSCGKQSGQCVGNLTDILVNGDSRNINWKHFCGDVYASYDCLIAVAHNSNCTGDNVAQGMTESHHLVFQDYCAGYGKPTPCVQEIKRCNNALHSVNKTSPIDQRCQAASDYLDCISKVTCPADTNEVLMKLRDDTETSEIQNQCPTLGSCSDRLGVCGTWKPDIDKAAKNSTGKSEYCRLVQTGSSCFNYVRSDATCISENIPKTDFETELLNDLSTCSGGNQVQQSISLALLAAMLCFTFGRLF